MMVRRILMKVFMAVLCTSISCGDGAEEIPWTAPEHPADHLEPWTAAGDSLSRIALQWLQALDSGDTMALKTVMADSIRLDRDTYVSRHALLRTLFYRLRSGYRQQTECLALLPSLCSQDSVCRVMGYLRQRYQISGEGISLPWNYRRLAFLWEIRNSKIIHWSVWEQDWPQKQGMDTFRVRPWPRWGMRCTNVSDSLRFLMLAWEKRLSSAYVRDAQTFWKDTATARMDDGWSWSGPPVAMARYIIRKAAPYRDQDSVHRQLHHVQVLRLGDQGECLGLAFGSERSYRNTTIMDRGVHRLYFWREGKIAFVDQYRSANYLP